MSFGMFSKDVCTFMSPKRWECIHKGSTSGPEGFYIGCLLQVGITKGE